MPAVNGVGEPCAGEPHARFDGRALETEPNGPRRRTEPPAGNRGKWQPGLQVNTVTAPALDPTPGRVS
jgi:hypothetical protein